MLSRSLRRPARSDVSGAAGPLVLDYNARGYSTFSLSGDFGSRPLELFYGGGGFGGTPTTFDLTIDGSALGQGMAAFVRFAGGFGSSALATSLLSCNFKGMFDRTDHIAISGTHFDDTFSYDDVYSRAPLDIDGSTGFDTVRYASATAGVTVSLAISGPQDTIGAGRDTLFNFEGLAGSAFADVLSGTSADDLLIGGDGDDRLTGGFGSDVIRGGLGETDTAIYVTGNWTTYTVLKTADGYAVTNLTKPATDQISSVEFIEFAGVRYAIRDTVNVGPKAVADRLGGLVEAGAGDDGVATGQGNVLANDRDANLATAGLGETLSVVGVAAGRGATTLAAVGAEQTVDGRYGVLTIHGDGTFSYVLDDARAATDALAPGQTARDLFTYQIADAHGVTARASLTVAISGAAEARPLQASAFDLATRADDDDGSVLDLSGPLPHPGDLPFA